MEDFWRILEDFGEKLLIDVMLKLYKVDFFVNSMCYCGREKYILLYDYRQEMLAYLISTQKMTQQQQ